jgi:hypothetical protein
MEPVTSPSSSSNSERWGRGNMGLGVSCSKIVNEYMRLCEIMDELGDIYGWKAEP